MSITKIYLANRNFPGREDCFCIGSTTPLSAADIASISSVICEAYEPELLSLSSSVKNFSLQFGPRLSVETAFSSSAVMICHAMGMSQVTRVEKMRVHSMPADFDAQIHRELIDRLYDPMIEEMFPKPITSFETGFAPAPVRTIRVLEEGVNALHTINKEMGLGMDDFDVAMYYDLFANKLRRNPTDVECFQLGQANSEHCRHWFFRAVIVIDGEEMPRSLMEIVKGPLAARSESNSIIAFSDNSSAIRGFNISVLIPKDPGSPSEFLWQRRTRHLLLTVETHNHPTMHQAFRGAETGTGGRIRDVQAIGRGGIVVAGGAAYCVGGLHIPGYHIPGENSAYAYSDAYRNPLEILIDASNGASNYGNQFGEPVITGFCRSFDLRLPSGERRAWLKPIMLTKGIGFIDELHVNKGKPEKGMLIVQIGGPAYDIGFGGGAASSMSQGQNTAKLDLASVQRGDAQMGQRVNRVICACIDMGENNPIVSIHDQGAGGPCNVVTELIDPVGGKINIRAINLGDKSLPIIKIWGAEFQERLAILIRPEDFDRFEAICKRERVPCENLGEVTGDGNIIVYDPETDTTPVDLPLELILGKVPRKTFKFERLKKRLCWFEIASDRTVGELLKMVLAQVSVGSKGFLVNKVDRTVGGLIAQQQCCGSKQLPVSNFGLIASGFFGLEGGATAFGEKPILTLIDPKAGARMALAEMLTNIIWVKSGGLPKIKTSVNWMWAAKLPGEGAEMYDAEVAISQMMIELGGAECDGGKDSLSMSAKVGDETVKAPGQCVVSGYVDVPDITKKVTPDLKWEGGSEIGFIDLSNGKCRMGGSALAQAFGEIGNECPDVESVNYLRGVFAAVQELIEKGLILSGHDRSDGGLITTLVEMALAGNIGIDIDFFGSRDVAHRLFNEELGLVVEYDPAKRKEIEMVFESFGLREDILKKIGKTKIKKDISIAFTALDKTKIALMETLTTLRAWYEATSNELEVLQMNPDCAMEAASNQRHIIDPTYNLSFTPQVTPAEYLSDRPSIAIIRDLGSNGDKEMAAAFYAAGFLPHDVSMTDLLDGRITLDGFQGIAFVGGFSNADVFGSAKGWAAKIRSNANLKRMFNAFYNREDTFSFGVCNGCQLMAILGWVPGDIKDERKQVRFIHNVSKRFDHRWVRMRIKKSPAMMFRGMEGSILGGIVAHGEGFLHAPDKKVLQSIFDRELVPILYVDDNGQATEAYPFNPNGSPFGATAICSPNGRHLAMMPHPERTFLKWQWHYLPPEFQKLDASPWLRMFQNARRWCEEVRVDS